MTILRNMAKCLKCGDVIESKTVHDFKACSCGNLFVDGGQEYVKRGFETDEWEELTEYEQRSENGNFKQ